MRWRQVVLFYGLALLLAVDYLTGVRPPPLGEQNVAAPRPRVLGLELGTLSEVTIDHAGRRFVAQRAGDGWQVSEPAGAQVPSDLVSAFATAVIEAEEIERQEAPVDLAPFGLDEGATRIELRPAGGPPETLWLGVTNPAGTAVYARRLGTTGVLLVGRVLRYYEELIHQALPKPAVPANTPTGPVGALWPLTLRGRAV